MKKESQWVTRSWLIWLWNMHLINFGLMTKNSDLDLGDARHDARRIYVNRYFYGGRGCDSHNTQGNPFAYPGINITRPFVYLRGKCSFDWFNQWLCSGEHLQSDLDMFQFDFMFVKPHQVPPLHYANVLTEMRFGVEQLLFPEGRRCKKELFYSKSHYSLHVSVKAAEALRVVSQT